MIVVKFLNENKKPEQIQIHAGIIKSFTVLNCCLVIEFKRSNKTLESKKTLAPGFANWTWTKHIDNIVNYKDVLAYLKGLNLNSDTVSKETNQKNEPNQHSLF